MSVDGKSVEGRDVLELLRGDGCVGTTTTVKFRSSQGLMTDATLIRTPMSDVERVGRVVQALEALELRIKAGADKMTLLDRHREVVKSVLESADAHLGKQQALGNQLLGMQLAISDRINGLLARLHPQVPSSSPSLHVQAQDQPAELKRQLDESLAKTEALRARAQQLNLQVSGRSRAGGVVHPVLF